LVRTSTRDYDKLALIDDLKLAGFEEPLAYAIADKVDKRKAKEWTQDIGRQEAVQVAQNLLRNSHAALDNLRTSTLTTTGQQDHGDREEPLAERLADTSLA
jgi:hypothetical protein